MGLKKICVPEKMDYFFHPKVTGKIVSLNKTSENSEEVLYQVVTEDKKGCKRKQSICLVQRAVEGKAVVRSERPFSI